MRQIAVKARQYLRYFIASQLLQRIWGGHFDARPETLGRCI